jgi:hypothetical protein
MSKSIKYLLLGGAFLFTGWLAAQAGAVPIFGLLVALFAPDIFLIGLVLLSVGMAMSLSTSKITVGLLAIVLSIALGLNTRLPIFISDIWRGSADNVQVASRISGAVGIPIHVVAQTPEFSARRYPYSHARPACYGDGCLATKGFRTAYPWIEADYWHEKVMDAVLSSGFSKAGPGELAPTLTIIRQDVNSHISAIHIQLMGTKGKLVSRYDGWYRNAIPNETNDGIGPSESQSLVFEYLLHGSLLNSLFSKLMPSGAAYPITSFLKKSTNLVHPQGTTLGFATPRTAESSDSPAVKVELEVLEEKTYDPVWIIKEDPGSGFSKWSEMSWDRERGERCKSLLKPEIEGAPLMQTWHLFAHDQSGRKKVRYAGNAICDPDAIWFLDYVIEKGRTTLTKYSVNGDLIYKISFDKPKEPWGYAGAILVPTFKAENGYVHLEWWNTDQSGHERHVKRSMKVRFKEPGS